MAIAIYNPTTNKVLTFVKAAKGAIPEGYEFRDEAELPDGWTREEPPKVLSDEITTFQFLNRFTDMERYAFYGAAAANPGLMDLLMLMQAAQILRRDDARFQAGMAALEFYGLLTAERKTEIMGF